MALRPVPAIAVILLASLVASTLAVNCEPSTGGSYRNGEEWEDQGSFIMRCTTYMLGDLEQWKTEAVACIVPGTGRRVPINTSLVLGRDEWKCDKTPDGAISLLQVCCIYQSRSVLNHPRLKGPNPNANCEGGHRVGSKWRENSFELECRVGGWRKLLACVADSGERIPVNGTLIVGERKMECQQFPDGTVIFRKGMTNQ